MIVNYLIAQYTTKSHSDVTISRCCWPRNIRYVYTWNTCARLYI